jgi:hypothetical protein
MPPRPPGILPSFKYVVADLLVGRPRLLYRAGFHEGLQPVVDLLGLGPLRPIWTANLGADEPPGMRELLIDPLVPAGLVRLSHQRPPGVTGLNGVGLGVYPIPASLTYYRARGTFIGAWGPREMPDTWAVVVMTREGTMPDPSTRDTQVPITVQSTWEATAGRAAAGDRGARMNTVGGAPVGTPYPFPPTGGPFFPRNVVYALYSGTPGDPVSPPQSEFSLAQTIDRIGERGQARVDAFRDGVVGSSNAYLEVRDFIHPFIPLTSPITATSNVIGTIGVFLANAGGDGPCEVRVKGFTIHDFEEESVIMKLARIRWPLQWLFQRLHRILARWAWEGIDGGGEGRAPQRTVPQS